MIMHNDKGKLIIEYVPEGVYLLIEDKFGKG